MIRLFRRAFVLSSILALALALRLSSALAAEPVELTVYHSPLCASCQEFEQRLLPDRQANYGEALVVRHVDISTPEGLAELELAEAAAGSFNNPLPVLQLDDILLADVDQSVLAAQLDSELLARLGPPNPLTATDSHPATVEPTSAVICSSESACVTGAPLHVAEAREQSFDGTAVVGVQHQSSPVLNDPM